MNDEIIVAGICGSLRTGSYTRMALNIALMGAKNAGAKINLIDLRNFDLPLMDGRSDEETFPEDVFKLRDEVKKSDGIILGTPEYHGGYSGVLKNALDLMGFDEFQGKMIGLLGVSGGSMGATNSLNGLHVIGRSLRAWVVPFQVSIASAYDEFDKEGNLKNRVLEQRVKKLGEEVTQFAYLHKIGKSEEFLEAWQGALINPGGERKSKE